MSDTETSDLDERIARVAFNADGLVAAIVQQHDTREVLMLGWMDAEALRRTLTSGRVTFWSRSRREYWRKGDTSGHIQLVRGARLDCDGDAVLLSVEQVGPACHTGTRTCFDADDLQPTVDDLQPTVDDLPPSVAEVTAGDADETESLLGRGGA
ncbi:phosphoribosyl-AMP cyclohydrolase [Microbacterium lacus]|uniref:phosphoribosyl-AMP cyclohydrolase n=1 Tax=Microbacterium lacus TaxID=415217 RepID=UPI000C2B5A4B|nr:phosphoribosyl-AMP cyclohydrolase [Microbacterium lacus]